MPTVRSILCTSIVVSLLSLSGCVTTGELSTTRDFSLGSDTKISVVRENDPKGIVLQLENELLSADFDLAPYETARNQATVQQESQVSVSGSSASARSRSTASSGTYLPSAVAITVDYRYSQYPAATYYTRAFIRVIDLRDKSLLASYSLDGSEMSPINMEKAINNFVNRLKSFRR